MKTMAKTQVNSVHFTVDEATRLLDIVLSKFKYLIEIRRDDAASIRKKNMAWRKIHLKFNSSDDTRRRSLKTLQSEYNKIKHNAIHRAILNYHNQANQGRLKCGKVTKTMLNIITSKKIVKRKKIKDSDSSAGSAVELAVNMDTSDNIENTIINVDLVKWVANVDPKDTNWNVETMVAGRDSGGSEGSAINKNNALDIGGESQKLTAKVEAVDINVDKSDALIIRRDVAEYGGENAPESTIKTEDADVDDENEMGDDNTSVFDESEEDNVDFDEIKDEPREQSGRIDDEIAGESNERSSAEKIASMQKQLEQLEKEKARLLQYKKNRKEMSAQRLQNTSRLLDTLKFVPLSERANKVMMVFLVSQLVCDFSSDEDDDDDDDDDDHDDDASDVDNI